MNERSATQGGTDGPTFDRGDRAAIVGGGQDEGVRGEIFWTGENKYGSGMRYGLRGDDGQTYWVDEANIGSEDQAPAPPEKPKQAQKPALDRGARVTLKAGGGAGKSGEVFWVGKSKYRDGMRYGVRVDDEEEAYWVDDFQLEVDPNAPPPKKDSDDRRPAAGRPAEGGGDDDLPPEAYEADAPPPEAYAGQDAPAGGDSGDIGPTPPPEAYEGEELPPEAYEGGGLPPEAFE